jgi:transposase
MVTSSSPLRFVALDIHRKYLVVGAVDQEQQVVLPPRRFGGLCFL